ILMWVLESDVQSWWPKENTTLTGNCRITYKPQAASTANVTVINQRIMNYILPWKPQRWQYFVWWSEENPWNLKHFGKRDPSLFPGFFNLTMTHRRDSDIFFPTWSKSSLFQEMEHATESVDELLRRKYYLALWEAKDCSPSRGNQIRMKFAVALVKAGLKYLKIGACFNNYSKVDIRRYMFYVVMVDGYHCRDYLNGQIWHALVNGLVPVVFGPYPDDVRSQLPYHSYIHAEEFSSPKELVGYINMVSRNKTLYREYFTWRESLDLDLDDALIRTHYPDTELRTREATGWSRLCERYRELVAARETRVISSLSDYVFNTESRECMGP
uniref:Fucosyltransferase n=1 Tax=Ciona savignyi TaxID=51511 RepID=H2Z0U3_CIOSA